MYKSTINSCCYRIIALLILLNITSFQLYSVNSFDANLLYACPADNNSIYGFVKDTDGNPIEGVVVSDGYTCVATGSQGYYEIDRNANATHVFYTTPANYIACPTNFFKALNGDDDRYDFQLMRSLVQDNFTLLTLGDTQVKTEPHMERFTNETMTDIKSNFGSYPDQSVVAVTLGDNVGDSPHFFGQLREVLNMGNLPMFTSIGNHDKVPDSLTTVPRNANQYMDVFGPLNYSFNRGKVHLVCLDNIVYSNSKSYVAGFTDEQVNWLKQDLSYVPQDNMVILYYHIPIRESENIKNRAAILALLDRFPNRRLICGHTHYHRKYGITDPIDIQEDIHGATCGSWWHSVINADGTPNGYGVYEFEGNELKNQYYKAVNYDKSYQIRLYKGDAQFGGEHGMHSFDLGARTIVANVWNADPSWTINVYEDDVLKGQMVQVQDNPKDEWARGYYIGVLNRKPSSYSPPAHHLFKYTLSNPEATIRVEAIDPYGNIYVQDQIETDVMNVGSYQ